MIYLWFSIICLVCYMIGNINFARILTWELKRKDITKEGSGNPGSTNVLRTHGFGMGALTMVFEFIKGGVPALIAAYVMDKFYPGVFYVVQLSAGLFAMLGQMFPIIYGFKGGKGLAVFVGVFFFSKIWYIAISVFLIFFIIAILTKFGSLINLSYIFTMSIATTIYNVFWGAAAPYYYIAIILVWVMFILELIMHRQNILRIFKGEENYINLKRSIYDFFHKKKKPLEQQSAEKEIIVEDSESEEDKK